MVENYFKFIALQRINIKKEGNYSAFKFFGDYNYFYDRIVANFN